MAIPISAIVSFIASYITEKNKQNSTIEENEAYNNNCKKEYERLIKKYNNDVHIADKRYKNKLKVWEKAMKDTTENVARRRRVLDEMYADNFIYSKYQNAYAISNILEFLESGRAQTVQEAYGMVDERAFREASLSKMDTMNNKLDRIIQNQEKLYTSFTEFAYNMDYKFNSLSESLCSYVSNCLNSNEEIVSNMNLIEINQKEIADNTRMLNYIMASSNRDVDLGPYRSWYRMAH